MKPVHLALAAAITVAVGASGYIVATQKPRMPSVEYVLLNGQKMATPAWEGQVSLVLFWATDCASCVKEMPEVVQTYQQYKAQGLNMLAVAMSHDAPAHVAAFTESRQLPFPVAIDHAGQIAKKFGDVRLTPYTVLVNRRGEIVKRYLGPIKFDELHQDLQHWLKAA